VGYEALRQLLAAKDGTFALMDVTDDPIKEVNQSLGVDLQTLLSSIDFTLDSVPISEESLTGMSGDFQSEITLIDTALEMESPVEELAPPERIERINQTYQKVLSLSEHNRQIDDAHRTEAVPIEHYESMRRESYVQTTAISVDDVSDDSYFANQTFDRQNPSEGLRSSEPLPAPALQSEFEGLSAAELRGPRHAADNASADSDSLAKTPDDFKRLKNWNDKGQTMMNLAWVAVIVIILAAIAFYGKDLATIVSGVIPKS
jgi:hypothetical protein